MKPGQSIAAKYRRRLSRALTRCGELEKQLQAERSLRRALEAMDFHPTQDPMKLRTLRRMKTNHNRIIES